MPHGLRLPETEVATAPWRGVKSVGRDYEGFCLHSKCHGLDHPMMEGLSWRGTMQSSLYLTGTSLGPHRG